MKKYLFSLVYQLFFWLVLFTVERIIFLLWYRGMLVHEGISFVEILSVFPHAFKLDMSTFAYLFVIPFLLLTVRLFVRGNWINVAMKVYIALLVVLYVLTCTAEIGLFGEWNTKLSFKALVYLQHPDEVFNSVPTAHFFLLILVWLSQSVLFLYLYNRFFFVRIDTDKRPSLIYSLLWIVMAPGFLFLMMRGGTSEIPISASQSYFSKHNILNISAVNPGYNIAWNLTDNLRHEALDQFIIHPEEQALQIVEKIREVPEDTTVIITRINRPNIVIILLESWPGDAIESLGGDPAITPEFHKLEEDGLLFTNFYATGNRSQQGNASIYAGLPGIPVTTLANHPEKYQAVPSLVKILNDQGYFTSFYFGGQLIYGNIKSFLVDNGFDRIVEGKDFDSDLLRGKLGVHDEFVFHVYAEELEHMQTPFFSTVFTLSSHSPYDYPGERPISKEEISVENKFINSVHYTDRCLGEFFREIKDSPVWDNTLFFIMSDHSHFSYHGYPLWSFKYHQIPFLITGGALKSVYAGTQEDRIFNNTDIPLTILKQLGLPGDEFVWSRDMFNPYVQEYAFFELNDGFGWKRPYGDIVKSIKQDWFYQKNAPEDKIPQLEKEGGAYVQVLVTDFMNF
jgi:phosphoglycerol transferase MdoB-like AlkP superfamily enzyme